MYQTPIASKEAILVHMAKLFEATSNQGKKIQQSSSLGMDQKAAPRSSDRVNLEGKSAGSSFSLHLPESRDRCCINIYINNNIQGANNSVLYESDVNMRDPGVHLFFGDSKFGEKSQRSGKRKRNENPHNTSFASFFRPLLAVVISVLLLLSLSSLV